MDHFELVEKLREKTGVSYEDAKAALEAAEWDLLDAIVILESDGKVEKGSKDYSTRRESENAQDESNHHSQFKETMKRIGNQLVYLLNKGNEVFINVHKNGKVMFSVPATVLAVLLIFTFMVTVPMMIVGLFIGFTYSVGGSGAGAGAGAVNSAMDKASEFAQNIKSEIENKK